MKSRKVVNDFHRLFYDSKVYRKVFWRGIQSLKCPMDLVIYQDLIYRTKPKTIVEIGTRFGGSTLFFADMLRLNGIAGQVISVDTDTQPTRPLDPLITYITGDALSESIVAAIKSQLQPPVMVVLDAAHDATHVGKTLAAYSDMVTLNCYCVVEDTNLGGNPVRGDLKSHPLHAAATFLALNNKFKRDESCERFLLTFNPGGYLKRIAT